MSLYFTTASACFRISNVKISQSNAAKNGLPPPVIDQQKWTEDISLFAIYHTVAIIFLWGALWAGKFSMLSFYRRLMMDMEGFMKWWWIVLTICVLTFWGCFVSNFLVCVPFSRRFSADLKSKWHLGPPGGHRSGMAYVGGGLAGGVLLLLEFQS